MRFDDENISQLVSTAHGHDRMLLNCKRECKLDGTLSKTRGFGDKDCAWRHGRSTTFETFGDVLFGDGHRLLSDAPDITSGSFAQVFGALWPNSLSQYIVR